MFVISSLFCWNYPYCGYRTDNFSWIPAFVADTAAVNSNGIKTRLANSLSIFFINGEPTFINCPRRLPKKHPDCTLSDSWVFDVIIADELFAKVLRSFESCLSLCDNLCLKLVASVESPSVFYESVGITLVAFFIADFNLLSWS